jgi:hypothetical protein
MNGWQPGTVGSPPKFTVGSRELLADRRNLRLAAGNRWQSAEIYDWQPETVGSPPKFTVGSRELSADRRNLGRS